MASFKVRRLLRATGGASISNGFNVSSGLTVTGSANIAGGLDVTDTGASLYDAEIGGATNHTDFDTGGRMTMGGTARVYKDIWIPADDFFVGGWAGDVAASGTGHLAAGSMGAASILVDVSGSIFAGSGGVVKEEQAASVVVPVLRATSDVYGSPTFASTIIAVPPDSDTTGSISCYAVWTLLANSSTAGSYVGIRAGLTYMSSSAQIRTSASVGASPQYNYTTGCYFHQTSLTNDTGAGFPSFGSDDVAAILTVEGRRDILNASEIAPPGIIGMKLRYVANSLGVVTS